MVEVPSNNRMKLTSGEGCARITGAHSRAQRAASWVADRSLSWCSTDTMRNSA